MKLYDELASWFHLLTPPADYAEEAAVYIDAFTEALGAAPRTLLELGSGGGNNASHYKRRVERVTLTDISPQMLSLSRTINPECEHVAGDMRSLRLGRTFDAVLVHDAVAYMTTEADLRRAMETAFVHCRPGGAAIFCPDHFRETFAPSTQHDGHDDGDRGLRFLEWTTGPYGATYRVDFAYMLREGSSVRVEHEHHVLGLFARDEWLRWLAEAGFRAVEKAPLVLVANRTGMSR